MLRTRFSLIFLLCLRTHLREEIRTKYVNWFQCHGPRFHPFSWLVNVDRWVFLSLTTGCIVFFSSGYKVIVRACLSVTPLM